MGNMKPEDSTRTAAMLFLGWDINRFHHSVQFATLFFAYIFFMCLYGLFQEIVIYEWFERKLGVFTAALHFLGCVFCAVVLHIFSAESLTKGCSTLFTIQRAPFHSYVGLCGLKAATQLFTNISMQHINFPTKILLKACLPVVTMVLGVGIQQKTYPISEVISVLLLTIGLMVFLLGDNLAMPEGTAMGFLCVFLSLISSALTPMWQEHLSVKYHASSSEMLLYTYFGSFLISLLLSVVFDEMNAGMEVLRATSNWYNMMCLFGFCTFAFLGSNASVGITIRYGALTNGICNSCRKILSVMISVLSFPGRNSITPIQFFGISIFSGGLYLKAQSKYNHSRKNISDITNEHILEEFPAPSRSV